MNIQVFLQQPNNPWADRTEDEWREKLYNSRTGRRLREMMGDTPYRVDNLMRHHYPPKLPLLPEEDFINERLATKPTLVVACGLLAYSKLAGLWPRQLLAVPHPNARYLVDGDPLFYHIQRLLPTYVGRFFINRDKDNVIRSYPIV